MKSAQREQAIELRLKHKLGYGEIAKRVKVAKSTLSRWLEDLPLTDERVLELRREAWGRGEAKRERFRKTMRAKRDKREHEIYLAQKKKLSRISEQSLFVSGLMLYAAEGDKKSRAEIAFSNTDSVMVAFLRVGSRDSLVLSRANCAFSYIFTRIWMFVLKRHTGRNSSA